MGDARAMKSLPDETGTQRVASRPRGGEMGPPAGRRIWSICGPVPATRRRWAFSPGIAFSIHQTELAASRTSLFTPRCTAGSVGLSYATQPFRSGAVAAEVEPSLWIPLW